MWILNRNTKNSFLENAFQNINWGNDSHAFLKRTPRSGGNKINFNPTNQMKGQSVIAYLPQFVIVWPSYLIFDLEKLWLVSDFTCEPILDTIGQKLWFVSSWAQYVMEYRGLCRHSVTSLATFSFKIHLSWVILTWSFHFWYQIKAIFRIRKFSKLTKFWGPTDLFRHTSHRK